MAPERCLCGPKNAKKLRNQQHGGVIVGEGGFGRVRTLEDLDADKVYFLDYVNLSDGSIKSQRVLGGDFARSMGSRIVFKEMIPKEASDAGNESPKGSVQSHGQMNSGTQTFLARFMGRWADNDATTEERAKWEFLAEIVRKGVRVPPLSSLMPLYATNDIVYLALRPESGDKKLYPLYRYMHGDLRTFGLLYDCKVSHVVDAARAVAETCAMLVLFGGIHHMDIKPENVLFRVRGIRTRRMPPAERSAEHRAMHGVLADAVAKGRRAVEFVLSDFGSAVSRATVNDLYGTAGYMSPLLYRDAKSFHEDVHRMSRTKVRLSISGDEEEDTRVIDAIWRSYGTAIEERDRKELDIDEALAKNDIFALGMLLLNFEYSDAAAPVRSLALRLVSGDEPAMWKWATVQRSLDELAQRSFFNDDVTMVAKMTASIGNYVQDRNDLRKKTRAGTAIFREMFTNAPSMRSPLQK